MTTEVDSIFRDSGGVGWGGLGDGYGNVGGVSRRALRIDKRICGRAKRLSSTMEGNLEANAYVPAVEQWDQKGHVVVFRLKN